MTRWRAFPAISGPDGRRRHHLHRAAGYPLPGPMNLFTIRRLLASPISSPASCIRPDAVQDFAFAHSQLRRLRAGADSRHAGRHRACKACRKCCRPSRHQERWHQIQARNIIDQTFLTVVKRDSAPPAQALPCLFHHPPPHATTPVRGKRQSSFRPGNHVSTMTRYHLRITTITIRRTLMGGPACTPIIPCTYLPEKDVDRS